MKHETSHVIVDIVHACCATHSILTVHIFIWMAVCVCLYVHVSTTDGSSHTDYWNCRASHGPTFYLSHLMVSSIWEITYKHLSMISSYKRFSWDVATVTSGDVQRELIHLCLCVCDLSKQVLSWIIQFTDTPPTRPFNMQSNQILCLIRMRNSSLPTDPCEFIESASRNNGDLLLSYFSAYRCCVHNIFAIFFLSAHWYTYG